MNVQVQREQCRTHVEEENGTSGNGNFNDVINDCLSVLEEFSNPEETFEDVHIHLKMFRLMD